jgi:hypothetical protein
MAGNRFRRAWENVSRRLLQVGAIRRWYARRLVASIDKSHAKRRSLAPELVRIDQVIRRLPKPQRADAVAEMLQPTNEQQYSREMRRAAERQSRGRGQGGVSRRRPGTLPAPRAQRRGKPR